MGTPKVMVRVKGRTSSADHTWLDDVAHPIVRATMYPPA